MHLHIIVIEQFGGIEKCGKIFFREFVESSLHYVLKFSYINVYFKDYRIGTSTEYNTPNKNNLITMVYCNTVRVHD